MTGPTLTSRLWKRERAGERAEALPAWVPTFAPLLGYLVVAVAFLGRSVVLHPATKVLGDAGPDKTIYMWSLKWWPWAIAHGHDPFDANVIWAPHGIDLAWVTAMPGASLLLTPVTELFGPIVSYNLAALTAPALAAWTAYLLARKLVGQVGPALVAGFIFGFSPYVIAQSTGHLNLTLVFLIPVAGLLAVAYLTGDLEWKRYAAFLGVVLTFQFLFSSEIFVTLGVVAGIVWLVARWRVPDRREQLGDLARNTVLAYCIAGVLLLPYLAHAFAGETAPPRRGHSRAAADVFNFVIPTRRTWLQLPHSAQIREHWTSHGAEQGAYLGLPLVAIIGLSVVQRRRRPIQTVVLLSGVAVAVAALGPRVRINGRDVGQGLWTIVDGAPFVRYALPIRLTMYVALFAALACALWLAAPGRRRGARWVLAGLAVLFLLPNPSGRLWAAEAPRSQFFDSSAVRRLIPAGQTVLATPYGPAGWTMLWQAQADFRFKMIGGHVGHHIITPECQWYWDYRALAGVDPPKGPAGFRHFLLAHNVGTVIEGPRTPPKIKRLIDDSLPDARQTAVDDVVLVRIDPSLPVALPEGATPAAPAEPQGKPRKLPPECAGVPQI